MSTALLDPPPVAEPPVRLEPTDDGTRREFLAGGIALSLGLAACGGDEETGGAPAGGGFPRTVDHELGRTRIDAPPQRVLAVTDGAELASLLALGVRPVAYGPRGELAPWLRAAGAADLPSYGNPEEPNYEAIAAQRPDLIVGQLGFVTNETFEDFSAIAPTVATQSVAWRVSLDQTARAVGAQRRARERRTAVEARLGDAARALRPLADRTVAWLAPRPDGEIGERLANSTIGLLWTDLGLPALPAPPRQSPGEAVEDVRELSAERLGEVDADVIGLLNYVGEGEAAVRLMEKNPLWERLPAVRAGRVVELSPDASKAAGRGSVLSIPFLVDELQPAFTRPQILG